MLPRDNTILAHLKTEIGTIFRSAPERVHLAYPSPYHTGMSSLGYQTLYREINQVPGRVAERAFLPGSTSGVRGQPNPPLQTYESGRALEDAPVIAFSVAYELELSGVVRMLDMARIPVRWNARESSHPLIMGGGPLTFSNPLPLGPMMDVILMGEADETVHTALDIIFGTTSKREALNALAEELESAFVPSIHGDQMPPMGKSSRLPARSQIITPNTELKSMFLIEGERGCSRGCKYCVMRRSTNGGMRLVPKETILDLVPEHAKRIGLVGAAISDHPKIVEIIDALAASGREVGLSSLRPDRLNDDFARALRAAGHRTLTTASDGASQRLRDAMNRKAKENHLLRAAQLVRTHGFTRLKLYMMLGLPDESEEDIEELGVLMNEMSTIAPVSLGIAPFVSKRNTPLDGMPFAGIKVVDARLKQLRNATKGRVQIRSTSARWAWIEYLLAQGHEEHGIAAIEATREGGSFQAWRGALAKCTPAPKTQLKVVA